MRTDARRLINRMMEAGLDKDASSLLPTYATGGTETKDAKAVMGDEPDEGEETGEEKKEPKPDQKTSAKLPNVEAKKKSKELLDVDDEDEIEEFCQKLVREGEGTEKDPDQMVAHPDSDIGAPGEGEGEEAFPEPTSAQDVLTLMVGPDAEINTEDDGVSTVLTFGDTSYVVMVSPTASEPEEPSEEPEEEPEEEE